MVLKFEFNKQRHGFQPGAKLHIKPITRADMNRMRKEAAGDQQKLDGMIADFAGVPLKDLVG